MKRILAVLVLGLVLAAASPASAASLLGTYAFTCITNNTGYCSSVAPQMSVELWDQENGTVLFKIFNDADYPAPGGHPSTITEVFFDNSTPSTLGSFGQFFASSGVNFEQVSNPLHAPGFLGGGFSVYFDALEDGAGIAAGIDQSEWLGVTFALASGVSAADLVGLIGNGANDLKIGIHVQSIDGGTSEGMVTTTTSVPEPASMLLLGTGLLGAGFFRRRRRTR